MDLFKATVPSPKQILRRRKLQAKGREHYILYNGIVGWGGSTFLLTTLWEWHDKFGWHLPVLNPELFLSVALGLLVWPVAGYFWGAHLWDRMRENSSSQE
jgi:hypothetical protein